MGRTKIKSIIVFLILLISYFLFCQKVFAYSQNLTKFSGKIDTHGNIHFADGSRGLVEKVILGLETDRVKVNLLDSPINYLESARAEIDLSELKLKNYNTISTKSYAIHGVGRASQSIQGSLAIFETFNIGQQGVWTIEIIFPKGVLKPSILQQIFYWSANDYIIWFIISCILILITLCTIAFLLWKRHRLEQIRKSKDLINAPPSDLSPAALAILEQKHATHKAIAAGILYLAVRGYVVVVKRDNEFLVSKRKEPQGLAGIDQFFYNLLIGQWFAKSVNEINIENNRDLFNKSAGELHNRIYQELIDKKLFVGDPWLSVHKTKFIGILLIIFSILAFFVSLTILPYPPYASIIWLAFSFISLIIYKISGKMPLRSMAGKLEREAWYKFKNYLSLRENASFEYDLPMDIYLPYAIALKCELKWIMRFTATRYQTPTWYVGPSVTLEDIAGDIVNFVDQFSRTIDSNIAPEEL